MIYDGITASGYHSHTGGGATFVCLVKEPTYMTTETASPMAWMYSTEYEVTGDVFPGLANSDAPCAVCYAERTANVMIPGQPSCPLTGEWTYEYSGYLMSSYSANVVNKEYVCVDQYAEALLGSDENNDGAGFIFAVADCTKSFLPCDGSHYIHQVPIPCVVCTK